MQMMMIVGQRGSGKSTPARIVRLIAGARPDLNIHILRSNSDVARFVEAARA